MGIFMNLVYEINHSIFKFSALGLLQEFYNSLKQLGDIHFELLTARKQIFVDYMHVSLPNALVLLWVVGDVASPNFGGKRRHGFWRYANLSVSSKKWQDVVPGYGI